MILLRALVPILLWLACLAACTGQIPVTRAPFTPDSGTLAVRCGRLIDGLSDQVRSDQTVLIVDGVIREIVSSGQSAHDAPLLDLSGHVCLPGLIDMHTHVTDRAGDTADLKSFYTRTQANQDEISRIIAEKTLMAGFTSVRNVGAYPGWTGTRIRDQVDAGQVAGPRIQSAGFYLTIPGGGGDLVIPGVPEEEIPPHVRMGVARGAEAFGEKARAVVEGGADLIKVIASGAVLAYGGVPGEPEMTAEEIAAVVEVAHAAGLKVAAHAHGARSIKEAIVAGADTIEHASLIDDEGIALALRHGVALAMDVYNGDYIEAEGRRQGWPEEFLRKNAETTEAQRQSFSRAHQAGVTIVFATDSGVYPHGDNARQFAIMVERGMTPMEAIRSATSRAARVMGRDDVGALEPGRLGDLIAVTRDPLADIRALESVDVVIKGGLLFKPPSPEAHK
ncbi:MAG TPA: amidohydrolase family protein [Acidobacteriota bacterium]|nr:amidohydrolase family protein [Acidobacteriota bacterium]